VRRKEAQRMDVEGDAHHRHRLGEKMNHIDAGCSIVSACNRCSLWMLNVILSQTLILSGHCQRRLHGAQQELLMKLCVWSAFSAGHPRIELDIIALSSAHGSGIQISGTPG
jgi:hypothetical protein